ncbi:hypothetical protein INR49_003991 [Caranx melampygus]|nr:hypothetical protein INR49_003991 [Caranx melampygus]
MERKSFLTSRLHDALENHHDLKLFVHERALGKVKEGALGIDFVADGERGNQEELVGTRPKTHIQLALVQRQELTLGRLTRLRHREKSKDGEGGGGERKERPHTESYSRSTHRSAPSSILIQQTTLALLVDWQQSLQAGARRGSVFGQDLPTECELVRKHLIAQMMLEEHSTKAAGSLLHRCYTSARPRPTSARPRPDLTVTLPHSSPL